MNSDYLASLFDLKRKVVIVTGACGQLGYRTVEAFRNAGSIAIGLDIRISDGRVPNVEYHEIDVTNMQHFKDLFQNLIDRHGKLDVLINNAGVSTFDDFEFRSEEDFNWVMNVNLKGTFFGIQAYVNACDKFNLKNGNIVNIGSVFGGISPDFRNYTDLNRKNSEIYGATKAGVIQMTKYFAVHLAERNIRVNCVSPGGIFNPSNPQGVGFVENYSFRTPMKRMANDVEMVGGILYFASSASSYTTGQNLIIDGGLSSW
jgi:NAD(P)-dependent dehydrogenase (short-subunit alcohol dehydrogenase family)